jgi:hypothetical protein
VLRDAESSPEQRERVAEIFNFLRRSGHSTVLRWLAPDQ